MISPQILKNNNTFLLNEEMVKIKKRVIISYYLYRVYLKKKVQLFNYDNSSNSWYSFLWKIYYFLVKSLFVKPIYPNKIDQPIYLHSVQSLITMVAFCRLHHQRPKARYNNWCTCFYRVHHKRWLSYVHTFRPVLRTVKGVQTRMVLYFWTQETQRETGIKAPAMVKAHR